MNYDYMYILQYYWAVQSSPENEKVLLVCIVIEMVRETNFKSKQNIFLYFWWFNLIDNELTLKKKSC